MMKLPDAKANGLTARDYQATLRSRGYEKIGFGAFAQVYAKEGEDEVIKIGNDVNADGYLQFVRWVGLRSSNPHLPYIRSIEIFDNDPGNPYSVSYYVVRMERLTDSHKVSDTTLRMSLEQMGAEDLWDLAHPDQMTPRTRQMHYVQKMLKELFKTHASDIKLTNVLFRDETLVITDPVAYGFVA